MFDEKEFIRIMQTQGGLNAVKYMKTETGLSLKECKAYLDKQLMAPIEGAGTITWFKCKDGYPPQKFDDFGKYSDKVVVWGKGGWVQETMYSHTAKEWYAANQIPFTITHWAFINLPND